MDASSEPNRSYRDDIAGVLQSREPISSFSTHLIASDGKDLTIFYGGSISSLSHLKSDESPSEIISLDDCSLTGQGWEGIMSSVIHQFQSFHGAWGPLDVRLASILTFGSSEEAASITSINPTSNPFMIPGDKYLTSRFGRILLVISKNPDAIVVEPLKSTKLSIKLDPSFRSNNQRSIEEGYEYDDSTLSLPPSGSILCLSFSSDLTASIHLSSPDAVFLLFDVYDPQLPTFVDLVFHVEGRRFSSQSLLPPPVEDSNLIKPNSRIDDLSKAMVVWEAAATAYDVLVEQTDQVHAFLLTSTQGVRDSTADKAATQATKDPVWKRVQREQELASSYLPSVHNKIVHVLSHQYSPAILASGWRALRGRDRTLAKMLMRLQGGSRQSFNVYLASVSLEKTPLSVSCHATTGEEVKVDKGQDDKPAAFEYSTQCSIRDLRKLTSGEPHLPPPLLNSGALHIFVSVPSESSSTTTDDPGADMMDLTASIDDAFSGPPDNHANRLNSHLPDDLDQDQAINAKAASAAGGGRPVGLQWTRNALVIAPHFTKYDLLAQSTFSQSPSAKQSGVITLLHLIQSTTAELVASGGTLSSLPGKLAVARDLRRMILAALRTLTLHHPSMGPSWKQGKIGPWIEVLSRGCFALSSIDLSRALIRGVVSLMVEEGGVEEVSQGLNGGGGGGGGGGGRSASSPKPQSLPLLHSEAMFILFDLAKLPDGWVAFKGEIEYWRALVGGFLTPPTTPSLKAKSPTLPLTPSLPQPVAVRPLVLPWGVGGVIQAASMICGLDPNRGILAEGRGSILSQPLLLANHLSRLPLDRVTTGISAVEGAGNLYVSFANQLNQLHMRADETLSSCLRSPEQGESLAAEAARLKSNAASFKPQPHHLLLLLETLTTMYHHDLLFSVINAMMLSENVCRLEAELVPVLFSFDNWLGQPPPSTSVQPGNLNNPLQPTIAHLQRVRALVSKSTMHILSFIINRLKDRTEVHLARIREEVAQMQRAQQKQAKEQAKQQKQAKEAQHRALAIQQNKQGEQERQQQSYRQPEQQQQQLFAPNDHEDHFHHFEVLPFDVDEFRRHYDLNQDQLNFHQSYFAQHVHCDQTFEHPPPSPPRAPAPPPPSPPPPEPVRPLVTTQGASSNSLTTQLPLSSLPSQPPLDKYRGVVCSTSAQGVCSYLAKIEIRGVKITVYTGPSNKEAAMAYDTAVCYVRGANTRRNFASSTPPAPDESLKAKLDEVMRQQDRAGGGQSGGVKLDEVMREQDRAGEGQSGGVKLISASSGGGGGGGSGSMRKEKRSTAIAGGGGTERGSDEQGAKRQAYPIPSAQRVAPPPNQSYQASQPPSWGMNGPQSLLDEAIARSACEAMMKDNVSSVKALLLLLNTNCMEPSDMAEMVRQTRGLIRKDLLPPELISLATRI